MLLKSQVFTCFDMLSVLVGEKSVAELKEVINPLKTKDVLNTFDG